VIGNKTVEWIKENAGKKQPFMVVAATRAPHAPYLPPPWYGKLLSVIVTCRRRRRHRFLAVAI
jgi:hypothetical protein